MISIYDKRPPFVRFEEREMGIDPAATEAAGRPVPKMVIMACITSAGSKDEHEKPVEEWLKQIKEKALRGEYPIEWKNHFELQYSEWLKGHELPREGTPIKTWAMATRQQSTRLIAAGITTVEDLAAFPDTTLSMIGLDGRYLRDMARGWINEAKDKGTNAKALADANIKISTQQETIDRLTERLQRVEARLIEGDPEPARRGRPRKDEAA
jgi:hypothetical protein